MDGARAYWDGAKLYSRRGNIIQAPSQFVENFPNIPLDGEIWMGRNSYEKVMLLFGSSKGDWSAAKYFIFDLPSLNKPFEVRMESLKDLKLPSHVEVINIKKCKGKDHLMEELKNITAQKGEGIMAMKPHSFYSPGRSSSLLKIKVPFFKMN